MKLTSVTGEVISVSADDLLGNCVPSALYARLNRLGEGTYGVVHRARHTKTGETVALKSVRLFEQDKGEGIPITALREISILKSLRHKNVVNVLEVAVGDALDEIYMVMEYCEQDLANIFDVAQIQFTPSEVKCLAIQLFEGLEYIHRQGIIHRDLKMSNLLLNRSGILKLADFGMAREEAGDMTPQVVTLWYRAPEILLGSRQYDLSVDLWSAGCVLAELVTSQPLLPGKDESGEMNLICGLIGAPSETTWSGFRLLPWASKYQPPSQAILRTKEDLPTRFKGERPGLVRLLSELLQYNPRKRLTAYEVLEHRYFKEAPAAQDPGLLPTFKEARNEVTLSAPLRQAKRESLLFDENDLLSQVEAKRRRRS
ncbi:putative CDK10, cyclin-dependent kinase 10 [Protomyces lactucae-debilis]|uniref:cyclin-dependent kinase n=1 Tax=Protomyces lactucae-debilis TaxID=2754530 RepID=A0A1Y2F001_PROLT|nr:putative CDK10, cyclin-dependent kinase 10 [Protomyces lactucae-debilis]ORY77037.1 putative CDK10, cyclin-dependent kinase 10 [Protomyces lactucae-debilis]